MDHGLTSVRLTLPASVSSSITLLHDLSPMSVWPCLFWDPTWEALVLEENSLVRSETTPIVGFTLFFHRFGELEFSIVDAEPGTSVCPRIEPQFVTFDHLNVAEEFRVSEQFSFNLLQKKCLCCCAHGRIFLHQHTQALTQWARSTKTLAQFCVSACACGAGVSSTTTNLPNFLLGVFLRCVGLVRVVVGQTHDPAGKRTHVCDTRVTRGPPHVAQSRLVAFVAT